MGKLQKDETGFSLVEVILVLVIVVLIGIVGWLVYKNHHNKTASSSSVTTTTQASNNKQTITQPTVGPYAGWQTAKLDREGLSFKYPGTWTVKVNNLTKGQCFPHGSGCVQQDSDSSTITGPDGFSLTINTGNDATAEVTNPSKCIAGANNCKQYYSSPVVVAGKNLYFILTGSKSIDGAGKSFEDNLVGLASSSNCIDLCVDGLGQAKNLPGYINADGGYTEKSNLDMNSLKTDPNVLIAKQIFSSLSY